MLIGNTSPPADSNHGGDLSPADDDLFAGTVLGDLDSLVGMATLEEALEAGPRIGSPKRHLQVGIGTSQAGRFHVVLTGNAGTGKTTVARFLSAYLGP